MHAIVLAAGNGKRFHPPLNLPKCLLKFGGKTLLARHIENLIQLGIESITIVTGYQAERVAHEMESLKIGTPTRLRYNPNFEQGSVGSLCQAADVTGHGVLLITNGDLLYDSQILRQAVQTPAQDVLLIDSEFQDTGEEFYIWGAHGKIRGFDHETADAHIVGEGVGIAKCSAWVGKLWSDAAAELAKTNPFAEYQSALDLRLHQVQMRYLDIHGAVWTDVDEWNDLEYAERVIYPALVERGQA